MLQFQRRLRHRRCFSLYVVYNLILHCIDFLIASLLDGSIENELRCWLVRVADMLHYTKTLQNYLTSQVQRSFPPAGKFTF